MSDEIKAEELQSCPMCGHAVVVRGTVTRFYVPVSDEKLKELKGNELQDKKIKSR